MKLPLGLLIVLYLLNKSQSKAFGKTVCCPADSILDIKLYVSFYTAQGINPNILEVPFRLSGGLILIEAEINEKKGFFILDSGAPDLIVNSKYLPQKKSAPGNDALGVTGSVSKVSLQNIQKFKWQEYEILNRQVKSIDLSHIESVRNEEILGLIGFELFKDFEILFDFKISRLFLYKLDPNGERLSLREEDTKPDYQAKIELEGHVTILKAKLGKHTLNFGLDTGAEMNILDIHSKTKVLGYFSIKKRGLLHGNGQKQIEVLMGEITEMELESIKFTNLRAILADLNDLNKAYGVRLDGVLGYHFLIQYKTALNFAKKEIYFWKPEDISTQK